MNKPVTKVQTVLFHLYDALRVIWGTVERKTCEVLLNGYRALVLQDEDSWRWVRWLHSNVNVLHATEWCRTKQVRMVKYCHILPHLKILNIKQQEQTTTRKQESKFYPDSVTADRLRCLKRQQPPQKCVQKLTKMMRTPCPPRKGPQAGRMSSSMKNLWH